MKLEAGYAVVLTNHVSDAVTDDAAGVGGGGGVNFFNVKQRRLFGRFRVHLLTRFIEPST